MDSGDGIFKKRANKTKNQQTETQHHDVAVFWSLDIGHQVIYTSEVQFCFYLIDCALVFPLEVKRKKKVCNLLFYFTESPS